MDKFKLIFLFATVSILFACTAKSPNPPIKPHFLKANITQTELNDPTAYKRYYYVCKNTETQSTSYLTTYFPLSRESRIQENFGIYFQLDGGKAVLFDHIENRALNARASRFEVIYRSYQPIEGNFVDLIALQHNSIYYKNYQGTQVQWLSCKES
ncbi:hypothetical protein BKK54_06875 [Rodentibacter genomosp. 1]|uniref:Lipoprotein n=1 Tax=Rodentibacter genomosp. 1 TaxID=1908264 RepID=A0A1V3J4K6_9PAST|nr:hypothetical protein [Rodentibacter genomosp. 1]OOF49913.1 hypothetical protein BKK54_06875 [Rodentibacter genomosp. 1]